jgi:hypothetical protein
MFEKEQPKNLEQFLPMATQDLELPEKLIEAAENDELFIQLSDQDLESVAGGRGGRWRALRQKLNNRGRTRGRRKMNC